MNVVVLGGGLFGCTIAEELSKKHDVVLIEKNNDVMLGASLVNHNRLHFGYHYPRSVKTAKQCLEGLLAFMIRYSGSVVTGFPNYYAIAKDGSFVDANEFMKFCDEVGIYYDEEYPDEEYLVRDRLQTCLRVREPIFDYTALKTDVVNTINDSSINVLLGSYVSSADRVHTGGCILKVNTPSGVHVLFADKVINATYSNLNKVNRIFGVRPRELRMEHCIIPIFKRSVPDIGLTVMDGAYCTVMPHGGNPDHSLLWHVDGSVYSHSSDLDNLRRPKDEDAMNELCSSIYDMSSEWMPFLKDVEPAGCFATAKAVEENRYDARTSEVVQYEEAPYLISVLGGKIATCVQVSYQIRDIIDERDNVGKVLV